MNGAPTSKWQRLGAWFLLLLLPGCSTYQAYRVRFSEPNYTVTPEYFSRSPRRVAVFPFATHSLTLESMERAQVCRIAFYQHFSVRDFEDVDMQALDRSLLPKEEAHPKGLLMEFAGTVRRLDIVGLTSFLDLPSVVGAENWETSIFRSWTRKAHDDLKTDAYVLGVVRGYGRLYAVLFSTIGLATHVEMRATEDDALLWSADFRARNISLPLTIDPMDLPMLLFNVWRNSRGESLDVLAFKVYRDEVRSLPTVRAKGEVHVRAGQKYTRVFEHPTLWTFWPRPSVPEGTCWKFLLEQRGWYQCEEKGGGTVWIMVRDGRLVDEQGVPLEGGDPLGALWKEDTLKTK